jgi:hypothetical protein
MTTATDDPTPHITGDFSRFLVFVKTLTFSNNIDVLKILEIAWEHSPERFWILFTELNRGRQGHLSTYEFINIPGVVKLLQKVSGILYPDRESTLLNYKIKS